MEGIINITVSFIGSGNVASKLAEVFFAAGINISKIYSKTFENAKNLAIKVNATAINSISDFDKNTDIIIISISDKSLYTIDYKQLPANSLICHTSGSVDMQVLNNCTNYGIFYPLQTFSKHTDIDISNIPFCLEANSEENLNLIWKLAEKLSSNIQKINSEQRKKLHLSAVFACNFTNAMYSVAEDLLEESELDFDILRPLIKETAKKALGNSPHQIQTGPAIRNDDNVMNKHIEELNHSPKYAKLYSLISDIISDINIKKNT